jgi:glycosyltransferase involved in cell wall biosynthesis
MPKPDAKALHIVLDRIGPRRRFSGFMKLMQIHGASSRQADPGHRRHNARAAGSNVTLDGKSCCTERIEPEGLSVSVIIIVKNGARFIAQALASVTLSQTKPLEILVVDGRSTDNTVEIACSVPGVTVIRQESTGIAGAYNEAIAQARGNVVAFLSSDDVWLPGKLDKHLSTLAEDRELLLSVSLVEHFLEPGCEIPEGFRAELLDQARPGMLMETLVARKRVFDMVGVFDPRFTTSEDTDWFARVKDAGLRIALIQEVLVRKRVHGANASLTDIDCNRNLLRALRASITRKRATNAVPT